MYRPKTFSIPHFFLQRKLCYFHSSHPRNRNMQNLVLCPTQELPPPKKVPVLPGQEHLNTVSSHLTWREGVWLAVQLLIFSKFLRNYVVHRHLFFPPVCLVAKCKAQCPSRTSLYTKLPCVLRGMSYILINKSCGEIKKGFLFNWERSAPHHERNGTCSY